METVVSFETTEGPIAIELGVPLDDAVAGLARGAFAGARVSRIIPEACVALAFSPGHLQLPTVAGDMYGAGTVACVEQGDGTGALVIGLCPLLDAKMRVVGRVRSGLRTVAKVALCKTDPTGAPITPVTVTRVTCKAEPAVPRQEPEAATARPKSKLLGQLFS